MVGLDDRLQSGPARPDGGGRRVLRRRQGPEGPARSHPAPAAVRARCDRRHAPSRRDVGQGAILDRSITRGVDRAAPACWPFATSTRDGLREAGASSDARSRGAQAQRHHDESRVIPTVQPTIITHVTMLRRHRLLAPPDFLTSSPIGSSRSARVGPCAAVADVNDQRDTQRHHGEQYAGARARRLRLLSSRRCRSFPATISYGL